MLRDGHSSGTPVARRLVQSTRMSSAMTRPASAVSRSARPSLFDLAPGGVCPAASVARSAVRSYRTFSPLPVLANLGGVFSVALSVGSRPPGVTWHPVLWSPDFPPYRMAIQRPSSRFPPHSVHRGAAIGKRDSRIVGHSPFPERQRQIVKGLFPQARQLGRHHHGSADRKLR